VGISSLKLDGFEYINTALIKDTSAKVPYVKRFVKGKLCPIKKTANSYMLNTFKVSITEENKKV
jgi:hypothetical protein